MSSGGYHHHVGANVWHSEGAGARDPNRAGLAWFAVEAADAATLSTTADRLKAAKAPIEPTAEGFESADPWGTRVRFAAA
jgi:catechol 2,3-dioxygenase